MLHSNLTRWIEDAEARKFAETASFDRSGSETEGHFLDLGALISKVPTWFRRSVSHEVPAVIAYPAFAHIRHRHTHRHH
jgi:hypothetical protein